MQGGPLAGLPVVSVPGKGRGLVTTSPLMSGQFVCEYAGEVIGESSHWLIFVTSDWPMSGSGEEEAGRRLARQEREGRDNYILVAR